MSTTSRFLNSRYSALEAYVPGEQPKNRKYIKLNTNESPYPPSPEVISSVTSGSLSDLRLYSDPECTVLKKRIADRYGVLPKNVFLSNGSDDILNFSFAAFGEQGAAYPDITYGFYKVFAELHSVDSKVIPLKDDFSIDASEYYSLGRLIVIANPNAPTGKILPISEIESIAKTNPDNVVLVDEAYIDFGGESALSLVGKYGNVLVARTFSKSRSMAGARLGFAIGSGEIISDLEKIKYSTNPYNINSLTQIAGIAAIDSDSYFFENCKRIIATRKKTTEALEEIGFVVIPSKANFIFAKTDKMSGEELYLKLKDEGILVRHFSSPKISDYNRITIGSEDEMSVFVDTVKKILNI